MPAHPRPGHPQQLGRHPGDPGHPLGHSRIPREITVPVLRRGRVAAIVGLGLKTTDYSADDVEAVQEIASLAMDFVERVHAEQALRHREHQLRLIIDTVPALIAHIDPTYRCRLINQTFALWFDEPLATILSRLLPEQVGAAAWQEIQPFIDRALAGEALVHEHDLVLRAAGHRCLSICYSPDRDAAGTVRGIVILANDITSRKQLEAQLLRSQRLEVVGRLAGGVAHDLNNILQPVLMAPELLRPAIHDAETLQLVDTIETSVRRGAEIIKQLLAFGRGTEACRVPLHLGSVVTETISMLGGTFPKDIALRCELPAQPSTVLGDSTQLHQVLMNLCVNARDAMRTTGGTLTLRVESVLLVQPVPDSVPESRPGRYQVLTVADTGTGILPENLPRLFDPFFTTKDVGEGTGLGLPTVLGIVRSHDGFLHVASRPGHGSAFRVFLPESNEAAAPSAPPAVLPPNAGAGRLVLVVDDEAPVRELIRHTLLRHDFQVREAANGAEALVQLALETSAIAIVIVDLLMPILDGTDFIRELRARRPGLPLIAISGHLGPQRLAPDVFEAIHIFLPKPFDAAQLLAALGRLPSPAPPDSPVAGPLE
ncbi:MAG: response regulator [Opitutaceae bacterium]|nr:response regulator [Opitutaceae bacterium]